MVASSKRPRCGNDDAIHAIVSAAVKNPRSIFYKLKNRQPKYLVQHKVMLNQIKQLQLNMSLLPQMCKRVFTRIADDNPTWWSDDAERSAWITSMDALLRTMCRDAQQGFTKNRSAPWVVAIFGEAAASVPEVPVPDEDEGEEDLEELK